MKLARTNLFGICTNDLDRAGRNYRQSRRPNATRTFDVRRPSGRGLIRPLGHNPTPAVTNSDLVTFKWCGPARTHTQWDLTQLGRKMPCHE